jgi:DNA-binding CsgD family transcriptional regulator
VDALDAAAGWLPDASERARREGSVSALAIAAAYDAHESLLRGWLPEAVSRAEHAWDLHARAVGAWPRGPLLYMRMEAWLEQGRLDAAEAAAALLDGLDEPPSYVPRLFPFCSRGLLRIAQGRFAEALTDLSYVESFAPVSNPVVLPWRARAATALTALGRRDEAGALLEEDARLARSFGTPRAVGRSLRATGAFVGGDAGIEHFAESVKVLRDCPSGLEQAHALVALGSALRRRGSRSDATKPLREGLDLAERSGAIPLAERARRELADAGARPHRPARFGRDQLTPSELRVAQLAAEGLSNKQIAQTLFVSLRTVETHLTHAYGKLDVRARAALAGALAARFPSRLADGERRIA